MLSVIRYVIHTLKISFFIWVDGCWVSAPLYAGVHDLTVMLAILQERMLGVIRHLTHTFNIFLFFLGTLLSTWSHVFGQCYNHSKNCCLRGKSQEYMYRIFKLMCAKYQIEKAILQKLIYINVKKTVMMAQHSSRHCMQVLSQQTGCST